MRWPWRRDRSPFDSGYIRDSILADVALAAGLDADMQERHLGLTTELIAVKKWEAAAGFSLTDRMIATIAGNATILILGLDLWVYRQVNSIIVHPSTTLTQNRRSGPSAHVVSDEEMVKRWQSSDCSSEFGPAIGVMDAALRESRTPHLGRNVVIHEFAHKIDMSDGSADGVPPLRGPMLGRWDAMLSDEYEHAKTRPSDNMLRPYAWTNKAEFFAVATEAFFCNPTSCWRPNRSCTDVSRAFTCRTPPPQRVRGPSESVEHMSQEGMNRRSMLELLAGAGVWITIAGCSPDSASDVEATPPSTDGTPAPTGIETQADAVRLLLWAEPATAEIVAGVTTAVYSFGAEVLDGDPATIAASSSYLGPTLHLRQGQRSRSGSRTDSMTSASCTGTVWWCPRIKRPTGRRRSARREL